MTTAFIKLKPVSWLLILSLCALAAGVLVWRARSQAPALRAREAYRAWVVRTEACRQRGGTDCGEGKPPVPEEFFAFDRQYQEARETGRPEAWAAARRELEAVGRREREPGWGELLGR